MGETFDFVVAGAGVVGLSTTLALLKKHPGSKIAVLEKEPVAGLHASGRNSGVIHSGIYYPPGTIKSKVCVQGAELMKSFAEENGVRMKKVGKVIIALGPEDLPTLRNLMKNASAGGIKAELLKAEAVKEIEPHCQPYEEGIYIPGASVIDSKGVLYAMERILRNAGVKFFFGERVLCGASGGGSIKTTGGGVHFGHFFNCAGAYADIIAHSFGVGLDYQLVPFKGLYFKLRDEKKHLVNGNIYPAPDINFPFLGVHFTRSIDDDVYAGPTAIPALGRENYRMIKDINLAEAMQMAARILGLAAANNQNFRGLVREELGKYIKSGFVKSCARLAPCVSGADLVRSGKVGIRPQLMNVREKKLEMDFIIERAGRSTHVLNAISPAFTGALSFAQIITAET